MDGYQYNGFLHELMDIFFSIIDQYVSDDFPLKDYFISVLAVVICATMIAGSFTVLVVVISETFKLIRGSRS